MDTMDNMQVFNTIMDYFKIIDKRIQALEQQQKPILDTLHQEIVELRSKVNQMYPRFCEQNL